MNIRLRLLAPSICARVELVMEMTVCHYLFIFNRVQVQIFSIKIKPSRELTYFVCEKDNVQKYGEIHVQISPTIKKHLNN